MRDGRRFPRFVTLLALASLAIVFERNAVAIVSQLRRAADFDEAQYVHDAWLMAHGARFYREVFDTHAPLFFAGLRALVPRDLAPGLPVLAVFVRARLAAAACGTAAVACAAILAYRTVRRPSAPVIVAALLTGSAWTWQRAIADVRTDPFALSLFWSGALLVAWRGQTRASALRSGLGAGLVALSAIVNPKRPLESLVLGCLYVADLAAVARERRRDLPFIVAPALALFGLGIGAVLRMASLHDLAFFVSTLTRAYGTAFARSPVYLDQFVGQEFCPAPFRGPWPLVGWAVVAAAIATPRARARWRPVDARFVVFALAMVAAGGLEIVFVYPFPQAWPQYYLMWAFSLSLVYGCVPSAIAGLAGDRLVPLVHGVAIVVAVGLQLDAIALRTRPRGTDFYWQDATLLGDRLRPGDTVWLDAHRHPIAAPDASYYWFGFQDAVGASIAYREGHPEAPLPGTREDDLPVCRLERGLEPHLRLVAGAYDLRALPSERACFERLFAAGRLAPTPMPEAFEVLR